MCKQHVSCIVSDVGASSCAPPPISTCHPLCFHTHHPCSPPSPLCASRVHECRAAKGVHKWCSHATPVTFSPSHQHFVWRLDGLEVLEVLAILCQSLPR